MGVLKSCFAVSGESVEVAVIEMYDEAKAREVASVEFPLNQGFDDVLGEPFLEDNDADQIGERVRPGVEVSVKAKVKFTKHEEQRQDQVGNAPDSFLTLTLYEEDLIAKGLLTAGKVSIRPNDRLLRLENSTSGVTRVNFEQDGRDGVYVFQVNPGETGTGIYEVLLEKRRLIAR